MKLNQGKTPHKTVTGKKDLRFFWLSHLTNKSVRKKKSPRTPDKLPSSVVSRFHVFLYQASIVKLDNMNMGRSTLDQCESWWGDHKVYLFWYYSTWYVMQLVQIWRCQPLSPVPHPPLYLIHLNQSTSAWRGRSSSSVQTFSGGKISDVYTPDSSKNGIRGDWHWSTSKRWELSCGEKSIWFFETFNTNLSPLHPPSLTESPLKKDDWKTILSFWLPRGKWVGLVHRIPKLAVENIISCWRPTWKIASWGVEHAGISQNQTSEVRKSQKQMLTTFQTPSPLSKLQFTTPSLEKTWIHQSSRERFHHHHQHHNPYIIIPVHKAGNFLQENRVSQGRGETLKTIVHVTNPT